MKGPAGGNQSLAGKKVEEPTPEAAALAVDIVIDSFGQETGTVCKALNPQNSQPYTQTLQPQTLNPKPLIPNYLTWTLKPRSLTLTLNPKT
jgi:hypothetical protein